MNKYLYIAVFTIMLAPGTAFSAESFSVWLTNMQREAIQKGVSSYTAQKALGGIKPIPRIIELDRKQPEGTMTFAKYKERVINQQRINTGRHMFKKHRAELEKAANKYGVPANVIVALWGIETSFGDNTGGFDVIPALATLAYDGRRADFFKTELIAALKILDARHIELENMKGSWAGAMGQNQFMPSSFHAYAVDANGDGKRDIWTSLPDVFASTANYLKQSGWNREQRWGREVVLPKGFDKDLLGMDIKKPLKMWTNLGVRLPNGQPITIVKGMQASVVAPDGVEGPAFLVYDNYRVIMKWNKSTYFATSVGLLSDLIAQ